MNREQLEMIARAGTVTTPRLARSLAPRRYIAPPGYLSPTIVGGILATITPLGGRADNTDHVAKAAYGVASRLLKFSVPTFFVSRELLAAVAATDPSPISPEDVRWPFPAMLFMLPEDSWRSPVDGCCPFVAIAQFNAGDVTSIPGFESMLHPTPMVSSYTQSEGGPGFGITVKLDGKSLGDLIHNDDPVRMWAAEDTEAF